MPLTVNGVAGGGLDKLFEVEVFAPIVESNFRDGVAGDVNVEVTHTIN